jgi:sporulation protein YunB
MRYSLNKRVVFFQVPPYRKRFLASLRILGVMLILAALGFYCLDFQIKPTLIELATVRSKQLATEVINQAVSTEFTNQIQYQNLVTLQYNPAGKVTLLQPNSREINRIYSEVTLKVQERLEQLPGQEIRIPFGQVMGWRILARMGPEIPVRIYPMGTVETVLNDKFDAAGINQVRHRIFLSVKAVINVVLPLVHHKTAVNSDILLAETIIVGDVPNIFVGNGGIFIPGK